ILRGTQDPSHIVRVGAIVAARLASRPADCAPIIALLSDPMPLVANTAADSLGSACADQPAAIAALERTIASPITTGPVDHRWQRAAHSLTALAKVAPERAAAHLAR